MIKIKIIFKSGRKVEFDYHGSSFREAANDMLKGKWIVFDDGAFQTDEIESMSKQPTQ